MIFSDRPELQVSAFEQLLSSSTERLKEKLSGLPGLMASDAFEREVCGQMNEAAHGTPFAHSIRQTSDNAFPDIVARRYFGVEVKMTKKDDWRSTGNSVREFSRVDGIERIYMLFGKFGGTFDVRTRPYQKCLSEVAVTHSPRYLIDMKLADGHSIFDKMGTSYDALRHDPQIIPRIKSYYRSQLKEGQELWWLQDDTALSPIIKPFSGLTEAERHRLKLESFVLFPEILGGSRTKYERVAAYWIAEHGVVSASMRDNFTAGGRVELPGLGSVSRIESMLFECAKDIAALIREIDEGKLLHYWRVPEISEDRLAQWLSLLDERGADPRAQPPSQIFCGGLEKIYDVV